MKRERDICVRPIIPTEPKYGLQVESCLLKNPRLNELALAYIHKPTVLKRGDASGYRQIALALSKDYMTGKKLSLF